MVSYRDVIPFAEIIYLDKEQFIPRMDAAVFIRKNIGNKVLLPEIMEVHLVRSQIVIIRKNRILHIEFATGTLVWKQYIKIRMLGWMFTVFGFNTCINIAITFGSHRYQFSVQYHTQSVGGI